MFLIELNQGANWCFLWPLLMQDALQHKGHNLAVFEQTCNILSINVVVCCQPVSVISTLGKIFWSLGRPRLMLQWKARQGNLVRTTQYTLYTTR